MNFSENYKEKIIIEDFRNKSNKSDENIKDEKYMNYGQFDFSRLIENNPKLKNLTISMNVSDILNKLSIYNLPEIISFPLEHTYNSFNKKTTKELNFEMNYYIFEEIVKSFFAKNGSIIQTNSSNYKYAYYDPLNQRLIVNTTSFKNMKFKEELISLNVSRILQKLQGQNALESFDFKLVMKVKEIVPATTGKWPSALGNVVAIDSKYGKEYIILNIKNIVAMMFQE